MIVLVKRRVSNYHQYVIVCIKLLNTNPMRQWDVQYAE